MLKPAFSKLLCDSSFLHQMSSVSLRFHPRRFGADVFVQVRFQITDDVIVADYLLHGLTATVGLFVVCQFHEDFFFFAALLA